MKNIKTILLLAVILTACNSENTEESKSSETSSENKIKDGEFKGFTYQEYIGDKPSLNSEMQFLLVNNSRETYKNLDQKIKNEITFYKNSEILSDESALLLQQDIDTTYEFLEYAIYFLQKDKQTIWINFPLKENELITEVVVQNTENDQYQIHKAYYFDQLTISDSLIVFEFAKQL